MCHSMHAKAMHHASLMPRSVHMRIRLSGPAAPPHITPCMAPFAPTLFIVFERSHDLGLTPNSLQLPSNSLLAGQR